MMKKLADTLRGKKARKKPQDEQQPNDLEHRTKPGVGTVPRHRPHNGSLSRPIQQDPSLQDEFVPHAGFIDGTSASRPDPVAASAEVEAEPSRPHIHEVLTMPAGRPDQYMSLILIGVRKPDNHSARFAVEIEGPWYMQLRAVNQLLVLHGYVKMESARRTHGAADDWSEGDALPQEYEVPVIDGESIIEQNGLESLLLIGRDDEIGSFLEKARGLRPRYQHIGDVETHTNLVKGWDLLVPGRDSSPSSDDTPRTLGVDTLILSNTNAREDIHQTKTKAQDQFFANTVPTLMRHLYRSQLASPPSMSEVASAPSTRFHAGLTVSMTAVYQLDITLSYQNQGIQYTTPVQWPAWWTLNRCWSERYRAGFKVDGKDIDEMDMRHQGRILLLGSETLHQQGVRDQAVIEIEPKQPRRSQPRARLDIGLDIDPYYDSPYTAPVPSWDVQKHDPYCSDPASYSPSNPSSSKPIRRKPVGTAPNRP